TGPALQAALIAAIVIVTLAGLPLFAALGGLSLVLFWGSGTPLAAVPAETQRLAANEMLPAIPLFTLAGHIVAAGGACRRLMRAFNALIGWLPGGLAIVATLVFAFFASFTGGSGVTILSLGGLLLPVLVRSGYPERFGIGLLTAAGAIGLLFPPSLPVILYGVRSLTQVNGVRYVARIDHLFIAGLVPGLFLVALVAAWGIRQARISNVRRRRFEPREALAAVWDGKWELAIPALVLVAIFGGFATLVEAAALTLVWAVFCECVVYRDLSVRRDLPRITAEGAALVGSVLLILGAALGLTNYLVDVRAPEVLAAFVQAHVGSRYLFLLLLNVFMLVVGSVIEIYSAILVVVPLVAPMGAAFGVDPVHLGIIFLANLELGYLFPPFGLNLLLSSSRFGRPLSVVIRDTMPFMLILQLG
ncbi:MAG: TRAP transporter large permease, partial [bacterium]